MIDWSRIGVVLQAVEGKRVAETEATYRAITSFAPHCVISYHQQGRDAWEAYLDAFDACGRDYEWVLRFEDDIWLAPDFADVALRLFAELDDPYAGLISLFSTRQKPNRDDDAEPRLERMTKRFLMAQAIAIPLGRLDDHRAFVLERSRRPDRYPGGWDGATGDWLLARKAPWYRSTPSIVQHLDNGSLIGHNSNWNRVAPSYTNRYGTRRLAG